MNNDTNNNLNGTVLGTVNNNTVSNPNEQPVQNVVNTAQEVLEGVNTEVNQAREEIRNSVNNIQNQVIEPVQQDSQVVMAGDNLAQPVSEPASVVTPNVNETHSGLLEQPVNDASSVQNVSTPNIPISEVQPQTQNPTPAYTNPNNINPTPMPGFDNSIGVTPPISLEDEKKPKKKTNKVLILVLLLLLIGLIGFGVWYLLKYTDLFKKNEGVTIGIKDNIEFNINSELSANVDDYAIVEGTQSSNCSVNVANVDVSQPGDYTFVVTCGEVKREGTLKIVDNEELNVVLQTVYKTKDNTLEAKEFAALDDGLTYEFVNPDDATNLLNEEFGTKSVNLRVSSADGKVVEITGKLVLLEHKIEGYLVCESSEQNVENMNMTMKVREKLAIANNNGFIYGGVTIEEHVFRFTNEEEYRSYATQYNDNKTVTINNVSGTTVFNDEDKIITITNYKEDAKSEFGEANLSGYTQMRDYFTSSLGYQCTYNRNE